MKKLLFLFFFGLTSIAKAEPVAYIQDRQTLQPGKSTSTVSSLFTSSGTIVNFRTSTMNVTNLTVSTLTVSRIQGLITDVSTTTHSGGHTFTALSLGTLSGTVTDNSTTTHSGAHTFNGGLNSSTSTLTTTSLVSSTTLRGPLLDKNLSAGTTFDYLLSQSSGATSAPMWSHTGLILQSSFTSITTSSATTSASFAAVGASVTVTPKFPNSIMMVAYTGTLADSNPTNDSCFFTITRNGTNIAPGGGTNGIVAIITTLGASIIIPGNIGPIYDLPNTASAITYLVKARTSAGGATCTLNANGGAMFGVLEIGQ